MVVLARHSFDHHVATQIDAAECSAAEEYHREPASVISEREFEARDLVGPGLNP